MFRGLRAAKRVAPAATRPFDQWCEIKSFTPLQLIAIASRPASPNAKNSERVSSTYRLGADESWSRVVSFSILLRTAAAQKQQLSRVIRAPHQKHGSFQKTRQRSFLQPDTFSAALNLL